ncbi:MAG: methyltransferase domain-containing protein [Gammaproteobacteria bacterium]|nr:methyltransferase domain-containing protein [Gammaproteobacteria bacterium]MBL6998707.1 methyltransferase domain-containing protein [Gammaproteobacteria bacterium]
MLPIRVRYQTIEFGEIDIHIRTLRDNQQFSDPEGIAENLGINSTLWPLFGVVWPSSLVMSHFLLDYNLDNKRILEIGCGIGLASILLNHRLADITATDYHPEVEGFLDINTLLNNDRKIPFVLADWRSKDDANALLGAFDLIIASDVLYEEDHALLLAKFIQQHAQPHSKVIVVDPGRGRQGKFNKQMASVGFSCVKSKPLNTSFLEQPFGGSILEYNRQ